MKLSQLQQHLQTLTEVNFVKPDGTSIPSHFHITEIGQVDKRFIDCGGTIRNETIITMQLWESVDFLHRLEPKKLYDISVIAQQKLQIGDYEIEVEYQAETISKFGLTFNNNKFYLTQTKTACLATDQCGIPSINAIKQKVETCCTPGGGCC